MIEPAFKGVINRLLQSLARTLPGSQTTRVKLHRARGVQIGEDVFIGQDVLLETAYPRLITIEDRVVISMRVMIIAHTKELEGVKIERDVFVGPGVIILPNVTIGHGSVVTAGSVVTRSVPPKTVVQGNPAVPVAICEVPLTANINMKEFARQLKPLRRHASTSAAVSEKRAPGLVEEPAASGKRDL